MRDMYLICLLQSSITQLLLNYNSIQHFIRL